LELKNSELDAASGNADEGVALSTTGGHEENENQSPWLPNASLLIQKLSDTSEGERKYGLSTNEMAAAFGDTNRDRYRTSRDHEDEG